MPLDIAAYIAVLQSKFDTKIASEHTYRSALEKLLEEAAREHHIQVANDPKKIKEIGKPDFILVHNEMPMAYVETKDLGKGLDAREDKEQFDRYIKGLSNLIITNYLEFRWYFGGEHRQTVTLGEFKHGKLIARRENDTSFIQLLQNFVAAGYPDVKNAENLAIQLARKTKLIAAIVQTSLLEDDSQANPLAQQKKVFQESLLPDLSTADFADFYAQTLSYGLFVARVNFAGKTGTFRRKGVAEDIPQTNPFLRKMFEIVLPEISSRLGWVIDDLVTMLAPSQIDVVLSDFGKQTRTTDPVLHFYETFLQAYNPRMRETRGVYYTPEPVVHAIVRLVDDLLIKSFQRPEGLNDKNTLILDPATGTGTFLYRIIQHIHETNGYNAGQKGAWPSHVRNNLLPRLFGFELLVAPYTVAHTKIGVLLKETGYIFSKDQRLNIYLTNTLENTVTNTALLGFAQDIKHESVMAAEIKNKTPIEVVIGNPPYSGHSANKGQWINEQIDDYFMVDGERIREKNSKWIRNDYVKFLRFGQWRIEKTGSGIMAYITDNGYLDNVTFRGVRQQLLNAFSGIYIINLHGSSKKKETTPDGGKDENVFDIQQGVAIGIFVKRAGVTGTAIVKSIDLWGGRKEKYAALNAAALTDLDWQTLAPQSPSYLFIPQEIELRDEYDQGWKMTDIFPTNVLGFQTHRDHFAIDFERETIEKRIKDLRETTLTDEAIKQQYELSDNSDWNVAQARMTVRGLEDSQKPIIPVAYRPFDTRYAYFSNAIIDRPRRELLQHVVQRENLVLNTVRQTKNPRWQHAIVTDTPAPAVFVEIKDGSSAFPLYLYPGPTRKSEMFDHQWPQGKDGRTPNLSGGFVQALEACITPPPGPSPLREEGIEKSLLAERGGVGEGSTPEDIFHYIYAVLNDPTYRKKYAAFLKMDFPRIPLPKDAAHFRRMVGFGERLVQAHLLKGLTQRDFVTRYAIEGTDQVEKGYPKYTPPRPSPSDGEGAGRVSINTTQYFEGIPDSLWTMQIGGYQVLEKWLKDRQGRTLSNEDMTHYQKIVVALQRTQAIMREMEG